MKDKRQPIPNQSTRAGGTGERRIQSFLDAALHVAGTHVPVPTLSPPPLHRETWLPTPSSVAVRVRRTHDLVPTSARFLWSLFHF